jgi:hypothetical protein
LPDYWNLIIFFYPARRVMAGSSLTFFLASQVPPSACQSRYTEAPATMAAIDSGAATLKQRFSLLLNCLFPLPNRNRMNPILLTNLVAVFTPRNASRPTLALNQVCEPYVF